MKVYVETNFVLEIAFLQEQHLSCDKILNLCEQKRIELILPAYSLVEPIQTLRRRQKKRRSIKKGLEEELDQITRSSSFSNQSDEFYRFTGLLTQSADEDIKNFEFVRTRLLNSAEVISIDTQVLKNASSHERDYGFSEQDAIVYSSVLLHLRQCEIQHSYFLNRDFKDFDDKSVQEQLSSFDCELITRFDEGYQLILSSLD